MKIQKLYNMSDTELVGSFLEAEKYLLRVRFGIVCIQIKFHKELKIKIRIEIQYLGMAEFCLKLKKKWKQFENFNEFWCKNWKKN